MSRVLFPEWRDQQGPTRYPFADGASLTALSGTALEPDLFADAALYPAGGLERQYLSRIVVGTRQVTLSVGDGRVTERASVRFDPLDPPDLLELNDGHDRPAGVLVSEAARLAVFQTWPSGEHRFRPEATEFVASCVVPVPQTGLLGFETEDGTLFTGDVWLVGEDGVVLRFVDGALRIDVVGDPLFRRRLCSPLNLFPTPRFVRTINGMRPNELGEFQIVSGGELASDTILRVYPDGDELVIEAVGQKLDGGR